jgi:hypothetical protein
MFSVPLYESLRRFFRFAAIAATLFSVGGPNEAHGNQHAEQMRVAHEAVAEAARIAYSIRSNEERAYALAIVGEARWKLGDSAASKAALARAQVDAAAISDVGMRDTALLYVSM